MFKTQEVERMSASVKEPNRVQMTILAALRLLQMDLRETGAPQVRTLMTGWGRVEPLSIAEIDSVCQAILEET